MLSLPDLYHALKGYRLGGYSSKWW